MSLQETVVAQCRGAIARKARVTAKSENPRGGRRRAQFDLSHFANLADYSEAVKKNISNLYNGLSDEGTREKARTAPRQSGSRPHRQASKSRTKHGAPVRHRGHYPCHGTIDCVIARTSTDVERGRRRRDAGEP
jgi:hypothetical protein